MTAYYVRAEHETCIVATRGKPAIRRHDIRSVFDAVVPEGRHSAKPDEFFALVDTLVDGPRMEIFARKRRPGWDAIGNELEQAT